MFILIQINGFWKNKNNFKNIFWKDKRLSKNKSIEFEGFIYSEHLLNFELDLRFTGRDHAGASFEIILFGYGFSIRFYDHRHWDYKNNTWEKYDE